MGQTRRKNNRIRRQRRLAGSLTSFAAGLKKNPDPAAALAAILPAQKADPVFYFGGIRNRLIADSEGM